MASNLTTVLSATLVVSDATLSPPPQIVIRQLNNPTLNGTSVFYDPFLQAASGGTAITLPAATCFIGYVKNLNSGSTNLTVAWTAIGASGSSTMLLLPGGVFIYFQPATGGGGFTAMTVTASAGTCSCEVLVGA